MTDKPIQQRTSVRNRLNFTTVIKSNLNIKSKKVFTRQRHAKNKHDHFLKLKSDRIKV
jgi:hypothetical protein